MPRQTIHVVQPFQVNEWGEYGPMPPAAFKTDGEAVRAAEKMHATGAPVVAFSREGDPAIGEYSEPSNLRVLGEVPPEILEAFCSGEA